MPTSEDDTNMALFCDFENVALGVQDAKYDKFDIKKVLERLLLKGSIVVKKAYCDWDRYKSFKRAMHEASFELIEIPHVRQAGKNSADIRLVVDALDLCYTKEHVDTFVIISGDSDFSPLVSKLRENDKTVIGVGVKNSSSDLLIANCDEFIYYDDLVREVRRKAPAKQVAAKPRSGAAATRSAEKATQDRSRDQAGTTGEVEAGGAEAPPDQAPPAAEAIAEAAAAPATRPRGRDRTRRKAGASAAPEAAGDATPLVGGSAAPAVAKGSRRRRAGAKSASAATGPAAVADVPEAPSQTDAERSEPVAGIGADESTDARHAAKAVDKVIETVEALVAERGDVDVIWGSMVKQTLKRREPGFNEAYFGFRSFNALLEEAAARGMIALTRDEKSGGYKVRLPVGEE